MNENELIKQLEKLVNKKGIKYIHIAEKVGTSSTSICRWRKGQRKLKSNILCNIEKYIKENA